jgi:hypothetical protein
MTKTNEITNKKTNYKPGKAPKEQAVRGKGEDLSWIRKEKSDLKIWQYLQRARENIRAAATPNALPFPTMLINKLNSIMKEDNIIIDDIINPKEKIPLPPIQLVKEEPKNWYICANKVVLAGPFETKDQARYVLENTYNIPLLSIVRR